MKLRDAVRETTPLGPRAVMLTYRCATGSRDSASGFMDAIAFESLFDLLGMEAPERGPFRDASRVFWFANGFQSWSPGWELQGMARHPRVRVLKVLERYTLRDDIRPNGDELIGHGLMYMRSGESYIALASLNPRLPPTAFRIDRRRLRVTIDIHAAGASFAPGETLGEIAVFRASGYWEFSDFISGLFKDWTCMGRAEFLRETPGGWESWYNHYTRIDESVISRALEGLSRTPNLIHKGFTGRGRTVIFQIDDGWQRAIGDWDANPGRFPTGMKEIAARIEDRGYMPGLWLAPFLVNGKARLFSEKPEWLLRSPDGKPVRAGWNPGWNGDFQCLDLSRADVRGYLAGLFDAIINDWGYRYLKLDFLFAGMLGGAHANHGPAFRWYREALEPIVRTEKNAAGKPVVFLGCGAPLESSIDLFPLMRIGADTLEAWDQAPARLLRHEGRPSAYVNLKDTLGRAFMNRSIYYSDPDVVFMRRYSCALAHAQKELIAAAAFMFGSQIMLSDDPWRFGGPEERDITERVLRLYRVLEGREYGSLMVSKDVWRCFSRDGAVRGIANLRSRCFPVPMQDSAAWGLSGDLIAGTLERSGQTLRIPPRSIALWC